jgi:thymidylate synthase (FAD)
MGYFCKQVLINNFLNHSDKLYSQLLEAGVAREQARMVLPLATTTKIHMTGSIRSWIHFLELRDDGHAQKEIQLIAKEIKHIFIQEFPIISKALGYE